MPGVMQLPQQARGSRDELDVRMLTPLDRGPAEDTGRLNHQYNEQQHQTWDVFVTRRQEEACRGLRYPRMMP
jgi:hypothetical protein